MAVRSHIPVFKVPEILREIESDQTGVLEMTVTVSVVADKTIKTSKELGATKAGKPVRIKAVPNGKYVLAENEAGVAPENITVKRVGKNLHVALEGRDPDQPELIIEEFFSNEGQLVGLAEDGAYHEFIAVDGNGDSDVAFLLEGVSSPLALGSGELLGFADGLVVAGGGMLPWMLAGLGLVGAGVAIDNHNSGGKKPLVDTTPPENKGIGQVVDDKGPVQGNIDKGGITDDDRPTLGGKGQEPGDTVTIIDNGKVIGEVVVDKDGAWTFTPEKELDDGEHSFEVVITDPNGNTSGPSDDFTVIIDTTPPTRPGANDAQLIDDAGAIVGPIVSGTVTDDSTPTYKGKAEPNATVVIYDNGKEIGRTQTSGTGDWTFTPSKPLADGTHSLNYQVVDKAGNVSEKSDPIDFTVDTFAPTKPGVNDAQLIDDAGAIVGPIVSGSTTDDSTPTYNGKSEPNATVVIYDNGKEIGRAQTNGNGDWTFTPSQPLVDGAHSLNYQVIDKAGNVGEKSDSIDFTVDTFAPTKPGANDAQLIDDAGAIVGPITSGSTTDDNTPSYKGKSEPNATVVIFDNGQEIGRAQTNGNGDWTFTPSTPLTDGPHSLNYQVIDKAGNAGEKSETIDFTVDTVAPANPTIDSVYDDQGSVTGNLLNGAETDDAKPEISGSAEAGSVVIIRDNGVEIGRATANAAGKWSFEPKLPLGLGNHSLTATAVDAVGNVSKPSDAFDLTLIDAGMPPAPAITAVVDDVGTIKGNIQKDGVTDDARPTIEGTAQAGTTVSLYSNGTLLGTVLVGATGVWSFTPSNELPDGLHNIHATATNSVGNVSPETGIYPINVDTQAPDVGNAELEDNEGQITGVIVDGSTIDDNTPTFNGLAEPGATVVVYSSDKVLGSVVAGQDGKWSFTPSPALDDRDYEFSYEVIDKAGNSSDRSESISFTVDTTAQEAFIVSITDGEGGVKGIIPIGGVTDDASPEFEGSATPGGTVTIYDGNLIIGQAIAGADGKWIFTPSTPLTEGKHEFWVTVTTEVNGESLPSGRYALTVDLTAPAQPTITDISDDVGSFKGVISPGASTDDTTPTLKGQAEVGSTVHIYDGNSLLVSVIADANGQWSYTVSPPLGNGPHDFTVTSEDKAGNVSVPSDVYGVVIDTVAPAKPLIEAVHDDVGGQTGNLATGDSTDDATPTISGSAEPGSTVVIYDDGKKIGDAVVDENGKWTFEPSVPLLDGKHDFTVVNVDSAGNESAPSDVFTITTDTAPPEKPQITAVTDNEGAKQGQLIAGEITDDLTPEISGTAEPNSTVIIWDNGVKIGQASVDANGNWTFVPPAALQLGSHAIQVSSVDSVGNEGELSEAFDFSINRELPTAPTVDRVLDVVGIYDAFVRYGQYTDDSKPTIYGTGAAGEKIQVLVDGVVIGSTYVDADGEWAYKVEVDLLDGERFISAIAISEAGIPSAESNAWMVIMDTVAPDVPTIDTVHDNVGPWTGNLTNGQHTDDRTPTFSGKAEAFAVIVITDNSKEIGHTQADANGEWTWSPGSNLSYAAHTLVFEAYDEAGNVSGSQEWVMTIGNAARGVAQVEGQAEPLLIQDLLVDGDARLLIEEPDDQVVSMETPFLDAHPDAGEWEQAADWLSSTSSNGFASVALVTQDNLHQLEGQLIG